MKPPRAELEKGWNLWQPSERTHSAPSSQNGLEIYKECQRNAFQTGMYAFVATGVSTYLIQDLIKSKLPYKGFGHLLAAPLLMGSLFSYLITRKRTKTCGAMWMAMENKHTTITPIIEKSKEGAVQR